jgi:hypothetical protein
VSIANVQGRQFEVYPLRFQEDKFDTQFSCNFHGIIVMFAYLLLHPDQEDEEVHMFDPCGSTAT